MMKRISTVRKLWLVALLALFLGVMLCVAVGAETYSGTCGDALTWTLDTESGALTIEGTGAMYDYAESPKESRAPWHVYAVTIKTVTLSDGVTHIGDYAFENCALIATMPVGASLTTIGDYAYKNCFGLTAVNIGKNITDIGMGAFAVCKNITSLTVDADNSVYYSENNCIMEKATKTLVLGCQNSVIPTDVTAIGIRAFRGCEELVSLNIPESVTSIGEYAFNGCTSLKNITIPVGVTKIEKCTFLDCTALTSVTVPGGVVYIGDRAFGNCKALESVTVLSKGAEIYDSADTIYKTATIFGYEGSTAQAYATKYTRTFAALKETLRVESGKVMVGESITVDVIIENNAGFAYLEITPVFPSELTLESVTNGTLISDLEQGNQYIWMADGDVTENGTLCTLTFRAPEGTESGTYSIDFVVRMCGNMAEEEVNMTVSAGQIEVYDFVYGDVTGDGKINGFDVIRLKKYLASYDYTTESSDVEIGKGADATGDGVINGFDLIRLKKYLAAYDYNTDSSTVVLGPSE